jgi:hypothetical protein
MERASYGLVAGSLGSRARRGGGSRAQLSQGVLVGFQRLTPRATGRPGPAPSSIARPG